MGAAAAFTSRTRRTGRGARAGLTVAGLALAGLTLAACATGPARISGAGQPAPGYGGYKVGQPYQVHGVWYYPKEQPNYDEIGIASWYGYQFHNQHTADGEVFDMTVPSAAHKTLPLPSLVEVTNLANGKKLVVRVNDRGPFVEGRIIDLSKEAAAELGFVASGVTKVRVRYVGEAPDPPGYAPRQELASARKTGAKAASRRVQLASRPDSPQASTAQSHYAYPSEAPAQVVQTASVATASTQAAPAQAVSTQAVPAQRPPSSATASGPARPAPAQQQGPSLPDVDALLADRAPATAATAVPAAYELQAGSFATEDAARHFAASLTGGGLPEVQAVREGAQLSYRVVVHGLASPAEAAAARSEAMALGAPHTAIIGGS
jgi:rare lipoprotein A